MDLHNTGNAPGVEIVNCIKEAGIVPDVTDLSQLAVAVKLLGGLSREEIQSMIDEAVKGVSPYKLCEFYYFRSPALRAGFERAEGGLLENAAILYPEAWAYLQTAEGQALCKTEEEWQAMTQAVWHTNADGTKIGWDGIGGAPFYAPNLETGALRLPDLRGMYAEAAGFDDLEVGGVHGDAMRDFTSRFTLASNSTTGAGGIVDATGAFVAGGVSSRPYLSVHGSGESGFYLDFIPSRIVPTANKNQPRAFGMLPTVYLGKKA